MKKYEHLRKKAVELRTKHKMTLTDICKRLALNKSTVHYWIKDIKDVRAEIQSKAIKAMHRAHTKKYKQLRENAYNEGKKTAPILFKNLIFRDFINIYLCEGYRKTRNRVAVANANAHILLLVNEFIKKYKNPERKIDYCIQFHIDQDEEKLKNYWAKLFNISPDNIKTIRKSNSGKLSGRIWRSKYGVLTIRVNDTYLRAKLQAWMDWLQQNWETGDYAFDYAFDHI